MARIAFIGAGSMVFTRSLARDILTFPSMRDATLVLMDIDRDRLEGARRAVQALVDKGQYPAKVVATLDRREALQGADAVLVTILAGGVSVWRHDIEIPKKYGVDTNIGDTRSVSGVFRALRTIPLMLDIARDMERCCPDAILLNYTNPMAMLCRAIQRTSNIRITGLCHSVQGTAMMLAKWLGASMDRVTYVSAGINHQAWYVKYEVDRKDAYPRLREIVATDPKVYNEEIVRNEMFLHLGYYVTESSGHNSEYNWWFRKRADLIEKYCTHGTGWNPGVYAYILHEYEKRETSWKPEMEKWVANTAQMSLERGLEYAASIINAYLTDEPFLFHGNVPNEGLIDNLPRGACVEVPVVADRRGFNSIHVGLLPPQCAALNNISVAVEEMAVEAALTGDPQLVYYACAYDPLTAAMLSLAEIKKMTAEMLQINKPHLPQFQSVEL